MSEYEGKYDKRLMEEIATLNAEVESMDKHISEQDARVAELEGEVKKLSAMDLSCFARSERYLKALQEIDGYYKSEDELSYFQQLVEIVEIATNAIGGE